MAKNWSFRRDGADIHSDVTISLSQALLGGTIRVPGVNDDVVFTVSGNVNVNLEFLQGGLTKVRPTYIFDGNI